MALARRERFALESRVLCELYDEHDGWDFRRVNLLLGEFGFDPLDGKGTARISGDHRRHR